MRDLRYERFWISCQQHAERMSHRARFRFESRKLRASGRELRALLVHVELRDQAGAAPRVEQVQRVLLSLDGIARDAQARACCAQRKIVDGDFGGERDLCVPEFPGAGVGRGVCRFDAASGSSKDIQLP